MGLICKVCKQRRIDSLVGLKMDGNTCTLLKLESGSAI